MASYPFYEKIATPPLKKKAIGMSSTFMEAPQKTISKQAAEIDGTWEFYGTDAGFTRIL